MPSDERGFADVYAEGEGMLQDLSAKSASEAAKVKTTRSLLLFCICSPGLTVYKRVAKTNAVWCFSPGYNSFIIFCSVWT